VASPSPSGAPPSFPLLLNSGRIRDQWHTMTRSGRSPKLAAMEPMPVLRIHPADLTTDLAAELGADPPADLARAGIAAHALVRLESPTGGIVRVRAVPDPDVPPGQPFLAMHWSDIWTAAGRINALTAAVVDPISGQPGLKANPVRLVAEPVAWHGLLLCREAVPVTDCLYWCRAVVAGGLRYDLAGGSPAPEDWQAWLRARIPIHAEDELISFLDPGAGRCRLAVLRGGALWALLYASREPLPLVSPWLTGLLGAGVLGPAARSGVLAGRPPAAADPGALVCTCLGVGEKAIRAEIARLGLSGLAGGAAGAVIGDGSAGIAALGAALGVGTQCGGCRPALARLLAEVAPAPASPWASS
jgi:assimilatory nitrate reductase catalytic subunit